jgi:hypothetical protein
LKPIAIETVFLLSVAWARPVIIALWVAEIARQVDDDQPRIRLWALPECTVAKQGGHLKAGSMDSTGLSRYQLALKGLCQP